MSGTPLDNWSFEDSPTSYDYIRLWAANKGYHIGYINKQHNEWDEKIARLITAAPNLLEACKSALNWLEWEQYQGGGEEDWYKQRLRDAISKAEAAMSDNTRCKT